MLAVVLFVTTKDGPQGRAYVRPTRQRIYTFTSGGKNCGPGGAIGTYQGEKVAVGYIDVNGRISPLSNTVVVTTPTRP